MNSVSITGYVGRDPAIKTFQDSGRSQATISISTKRRSARRAGEDVTDWHRVVVTASDLVKSYIEPFVTKGALISITGELVYNSFDSEGKTVRLSEIVVTDPRGVQIIHRPSRGVPMIEEDAALGERPETDAEPV